LLRDEVRRAMAELYDESLLPRFFAVYGEGTARADWVDQAVAARRAVEQDLGVRVEDRRVSTLWCGPLLSVLIGDAERLAAEYNSVLGAYRRRFRVRGPHRPIPDLDVGDGVCETPLWVYRLGEPRRRLFMRRTASALELLADRDVIASLDPERVSDWERLNDDLRALLPWHIRPRALMLTLWARLLLADLFIHGIGGAKYDRITDELIRRYFRVEPPAMACVSATLRLPLACARMDDQVVYRAQRSVRDVRYNPERYLPNGAVDALAAQKHALVAESQRLRRNAPQEHRARRALFLHIRELNAEMLAADRALVGRLVDELRSAETAAARRAVAEHRAFFFAMHRRSDLEQLMANLPDVTQLRTTAIV
jgi:hypothetical protein